MTRIRGFVALLGFLRLNFRFRGKLYDIVIRGVVSLYGEKEKNYRLPETSFIIIRKIYKFGGSCNISIPRLLSF